MPPLQSPATRAALSAMLDGRIILTTPRLILRNWRPDDLDPYAAMAADPEVMRWLGGTRSRTKTLSELEGSAHDLATCGFGKIAVERRADGAFLGMCGLSVEHWYPDDVEIGWRIAPAAQGQGYATEAALAWRDHAFATLNLPRLISIADVPNHRSIRVMQKIGMTLDHTATLPDGDDTFDAVIHALARPLALSALRD
jgi:RimJ/RimL family protein N-acetyltransferase